MSAAGSGLRRHARPLQTPPSQRRSVLLIPAAELWALDPAERFGPHPQQFAAIEVLGSASNPEPTRSCSRWPAEVLRRQHPTPTQRLDAQLIVMESSFSLKASRSSVTRTVKVNVPAPVGVPEMVFSRL